MVQFNHAIKEVTIKIVYYGPGLCGKTTNLQQIHKRTNPEEKLLSLNTETDRTLYFDLLRINLPDMNGMKARVQLFTVPGQVFYNDMRRMVLTNADGIVFVADSQRQLQDSNEESFENLCENLAANDLSLDTIPLVLQYNKRDSQSAVPVEELNRRLNKRDFQYHEAIACDGIGVMETMEAIVRLASDRIRSTHFRTTPEVKTQDPLPRTDKGKDGGSDGIDASLLSELVDVVEDELTSAELFLAPPAQQTVAEESLTPVAASSPEKLPEANAAPAHAADNLQTISLTLPPDTPDAGITVYIECCAEGIEVIATKVEHIAHINGSHHSIPVLLKLA